MKKLRILFTVLAAICLVAIIPMGMFLDWIGFLVCGVPALIFFLLMLLCKQTQEKQENQNGSADFLSLEQVETDGQTTDKPNADKK